MMLKILRGRKADDVESDGRRRELERFGKNRYISVFAKVMEKEKS